MNRSESGKLGGLKGRETQRKKHLERVAAYEKNPKPCKLCRKSIDYKKKGNDFCCRSCAGTFNNLLRIGENVTGEYVIEEHPCLCCGKILTARRKRRFCNNECSKTYNWKVTKEQLLKGGCDFSSCHHIAKKYLIEVNNGCCQVCGLSEWNGKPMPLVLDHIDGNSENGKLENLRVICNNCDALTDTYKSKNLGNGRAKRRERYRTGKSY